MDEDELGFDVPFNIISVILGQWKGEHERLCAIQAPFRFGKDIGK